MTYPTRKEIDDEIEAEKLPLQDEYTEEEKKLAIEIFGTATTPMYAQERRNGFNLALDQMKKNIHSIRMRDLEAIEQWALKKKKDTEDFTLYATPSGGWNLSLDELGFLLHQLKERV